MKDLSKYFDAPLRKAIQSVIKQGSAVAKTSKPAPASCVGKKIYSKAWPIGGGFRYLYTICDNNYRGGVLCSDAEQGGTFVRIANRRGRPVGVKSWKEICSLVEEGTFELR